MAMKELALYVAEQLSSLNEIRYISMMGGWLFYYRGKIIGGIYGDGFAVKDTEASRRYMPDCREEIWANTPNTLLPCTILDDSERLCAMVMEMYPELPEPKSKKKKKR
ncbi:MAG: TfoX/Sxy family protein [Lachnospiraceae bacterium]